MAAHASVHAQTDSTAMGMPAGVTTLQECLLRGLEHNFSIKMVKIQPEINFMKARYFGDKDTIAEEQSRLFKREKYNPMASILPLVLQLVLLMGVIGVIKAGIGDPKIDMGFLGIDLSLVPNDQGGWLILSPVIAGLSAWLLCVAQNASNVLQSEQSKWNKYGTMLLSVGLSLYLGWFVSVGVALYWVASNILAIVQLYLLNWAINPKKYVDYEQLEKSKKELAALAQIGISAADEERVRRVETRIELFDRRHHRIGYQHQEST